MAEQLFCRQYKTPSGQKRYVKVDKSYFGNKYRVRRLKNKGIFTIADKDTGFNLTKSQATKLANKVVRTGKW